MQDTKNTIGVELRARWRRYRLRLGLALSSAIALGAVLMVPATRSADDEILLYPLPEANYGALLHVTGHAPPQQAIRIEANQVVVAKTRANESGDFAVAISLPAGANAVQAVAEGISAHPLSSVVYSVKQDAPFAQNVTIAAEKTAATAKAGDVVILAAAAPTITVPPATTSANPITLSGTAPASAKVGFYVNGRFTREVTATTTGTYSTWVPLEDGLNSIYAIATDATGPSVASNTVQTTYTNTLPRTYAVTTISTPIVWTAGNAPTYTLNGTLTIAAAGTLWIQPGVTVNVSGNYRILANGNFVIRGTQAARTVLRPTQSLCTDTSAGRNDWVGVEAAPATGVVSFQYADVYCANYGVNFNTGTGSLAYTRLLNGIRGVWTKGNSTRVITPQIVGQNELRGNEYGLYIDIYSRPTVSGSNLITGNLNGVHVEGNGTAAQNPVPVVNGNSLYANSTANFLATNFGNAATTILNAQGNWWGTSDPSAILATIDDRNRGGATSPYVNYAGFLGAAGGTSAYTGQTLVGPITANTTLAAGSYLMLSDVVVNATRTLTLSPGTFIRAIGGRKILVNGTLTANGTSTQRVRFGSGKPYPAKPTSNGLFDWAGIEVAAGGIANLNYARVEHATNGVYFKGGQGTITRSLIRFNTYGIFVGTGSSPTINQSNEISNNSYGIYVDALGGTSSANDPKPIVNGNSLFANSNYNYYTTGYNFSPKPTLNATGNWWGTNVPANIAATIYTALSSSAPVNSSGYLTTEPFLPAITLSGFAMSTQEARPLVTTLPAAGTFSLSRAGTVTFQVKRESDDALVRQWSQSFVTGANSFSWDGRGDLGQLLSAGLYRIVLTASDGLDPFDYDAPASTDPSAPDCGFFCQVPATFNPYRNEMLKVQVQYSVPTLGNLQVTPQGAATFYTLNDVYYPAGSHWLYWDGRWPDGTLVTVPSTVWAGDGKRLRPNGVYVFSPKVEITGLGAAPNIEVRSDPDLVASSYEQSSRIVYRVSLDATVRVTILPPGVVDPASPSAIVLVNNVTQPAKDGNGVPIDYTAQWRGYNVADPNAMLANEGVYTFAIEATLPATGQKTLYRGILNITQ